MTRTAARDLALQGSEAFDKGQYSAALDLFQRAGALVRAPTISLMQARSLVQLGRWVEALDTYEAAQHVPGIDPGNPAFSAAIASAADEARALKARVPRLKIELEGSVSPEIEVLLDERKLPSALVGVEMPCDPGEHRVEVRAPNHPALTRTVALTEGTRELVSIPLVAPPPVQPVELPKPAPPRAAASPPPTTGTDELRTLSWIALIGGGASMGAGLVTSILALDKRSELESVCRPGCPPAYRDDIGQFRTYRNVSYLTIGLGAAAAALGGGYLLFSRRAESHSASLDREPSGVRMVTAF
ncbi:MAG TPA: hypothetical protein VFQ35_08185 [Polyangiaceae bacterium]|nr:hypothetical protein [Polyangiaceae bacterium]